MFVVLMEPFEVFRVVRKGDDSLVSTPLDEFNVSRVFSELIFS